MANYGNCEINFLRGTWKPCSFHFLWGKVMVSVNKMQFGIFYLYVQFPRLGCGILWGVGWGFFCLVIVLFVFFFIWVCPIKLDPFSNKIIIILQLLIFQRKIDFLNGLLKLIRWGKKRSRSKKKKRVLYEELYFYYMRRQSFFIYSL